MKLKRLIALFIVAILCFSSVALVACGKDEEECNHAEWSEWQLNTDGTKEIRKCLACQITEEKPIDEATYLSTPTYKSYASAPDTTSDNNRVFYQIFVGSFSDSNGDGIGDIRGIINRFDYLNDGNVNSTTSLGVQGIWLSPIFESPTYHKYDVQDYYTIDPQFGTMKDLEDLIALCHSRNVKLILDLVINHTSEQHEYFKQFVAAHQQNDTDSPYYDYYSHGTLEDFSGKTCWEIPGCDDVYYECNFGGHMPEPNFDNEQVKQDFVDIAKFYIDKGIDGFRFDAVKYIYFNDADSSVEFWKWYMAQLKALKADIYAVGECWSGDTEILQYTEAMSCFSFQMSGPEGQICSTVKNRGNISSYVKYVENYLQKMNQANPSAIFAPFFSNHDQDRSAGYPSYINMEMAANIYMLCSGSPFIYYGEEIGLKGSRGGANTDANRRLGMLWGDGDTIADPEGTTYDSKKQTNGTVASQTNNQNSLLNHYRRLISVRTRHPEIARGDYTALDYGEKQFAGFKVTYNNSTILILHNTSLEVMEIDLTAGGKYQVNPTQIADVIGKGNAILQGTTLKIGPQTSVIIK